MNRLIASRLALLAGGVACLVLAGVWWARDLARGEEAPAFADPDRPAAGPPAPDEPDKRPLGQLADGPLTGREALWMQQMVVREGLERLYRQDSYRCRFTMLERVDGTLRDPNDVELIVRHEPFSVAMFWPDTGRRVVYVDGENNNRMLVNVGRGHFLLRRLRLDPHSPRVTRESRYPVTESGVGKLAERVLALCRRAVALDEGVTAEARLVRAGEQDRLCYRFVIEHADPEVDPKFRKAITWVDAELLLPIAVRNYGWPAPGDSDERTLLEHYTYEEIDFHYPVSDEDFLLDPRIARGRGESP